MEIARFELVFWLNPLDDKAKYNFGSSCCKPVTVSEMLALTGTNRDEFFREIENMSLHYGYFEGMPRLKTAIASLYTDAVTPEMVLTVHGGTGANSIVCQALCGSGDNVVCVLPSYQQHYSIPEALGSEVRIFNCGAGEEYRVDLEKIRAMVDGKTKMICLTNPGNPTGYRFSKAELEEIASMAANVGAYVLCDEIYRGLADEYMYSICDLYEKGIVTSSTSKVFSSAGTRVGWIVTRDLSIKESLMNCRSYNSICEGAINELIAAVILENKDVFYERNRKIVEEARAALYEWLKSQPHLRLACDSSGPTSYIYYDFDIPAQKFAEDLLAKKGVLVCQGGCFQQEKSFRIGYGFGDANYFKEGLALMGEYIKELEQWARGAALFNGRGKV